MRIKVHGGTAFGSENLCRTCRSATFIKGHAMSREVVYCGQINEYLKFPVSDCSDYHSKNQTSLREMKETAWILIPRKGQPLGFVSQQDFSRMREEKEIHDARFTPGHYDEGYDDD